MQIAASPPVDFGNSASRERFTFRVAPDAEPVGDVLDSLIDCLLDPTTAGDGLDADVGTEAAA